jgi:hypothetical protein
MMLLLLLSPSSLPVDSVGHNSKLHQWLACGRNCAWRLDRNMTRQQPLFLRNSYKRFEVASTGCQER